MKKTLILLTAVLSALCITTVFAGETNAQHGRPTAIYGAKTFTQDQKTEEDQDSAIPIGQILPEVSYTTIDGETFDTAEVLKDKNALLINFFMVTCPNCIDEIPIFHELAEEYGDRAAFLMLDSNMFDSQEAIREFRDQNNISFPVAQETEWVLSDLIPYEYYPCTIVLDKNGAMVFYQEFGIDASDELKEVFDTILSEDYEGGFERMNILESEADGTVEEESEAKPSDEYVDNGYLLVVEDQDGNPVADVMINFCSETQQTCRMNASNGEGEIFFEVPEDTYHIEVLAAPEGYSYDSDFEMYTDANYGDPIHITINKD